MVGIPPVRVGTPPVRAGTRPAVVGKPPVVPGPVVERKWARAARPVFWAPQVGLFPVFLPAVGSAVALCTGRTPPG